MCACVCVCMRTLRDMRVLTCSEEPISIKSTGTRDITQPGHPDCRGKTIKQCRIKKQKKEGRLEKGRKKRGKNKERKKEREEKKHLEGRSIFINFKSKSSQTEVINKCIYLFTGSKLQDNCPHNPSLSGHPQMSASHEQTTFPVLSPHRVCLVPLFFLLCPHVSYHAYETKCWSFPGLPVMRPSMIFSPKDANLCRTKHIPCVSRYSNIP